MGGSGRLWAVEQDGDGRFENLERKMQLPPSKDFPPGELLGWAVFVEKGMLQEWLCYDDVCDVDVGCGGYGIWFLIVCVD